jgi:hypothetical protein
MILNEGEKMTEHDKEALGKEVLRLFEVLHDLFETRTWQKQDFVGIADMLRNIASALEQDRRVK